MNNNSYIVSISADPIKNAEDRLKYIKSLQDNYLIDYVHLDVMDGLFVQKYSYDNKFVKTVNANTVVQLDVHLMMINPQNKIEDYIRAGANILTLQYEAFKSRAVLIKALKKIKLLGAFAGIAINPNTEISNIIEFMPYVDRVTVMSVEAGESGQKFIESTFVKLKILNEVKKHFKFKFSVAVDGGIGMEQANKLKDFDVSTIIIGSAFYNAENKNLFLKRIRRKL